LREQRRFAARKCLVAGQLAREVSKRLAAFHQHRAQHDAPRKFSALVHGPQVEILDLSAVRTIS